MAAAAAVYSTDDGTNIIVNKEHVEFVVRYLNDVYDSKALAYDRFSADEFEKQRHNRCSDAAPPQRLYLDTICN